MTRWKQGIDVMIPKKIGSLRASQLRTIVLMEPDFNFINKIMGRRVMDYAEKNQSIAAEQFGSRKIKSAITHAINKQLTTDIMRQDHRHFILILLDARSCYDRISPPIASICLQRHGTPLHLVQLMFNTIQEMQHFIRTSYGDSDEWYQATSERFHGILQGNGAGPTIWALVSTPLLDRLRQKKYGVTINTVHGEVLQIPAFAFVDDVDLVQELAHPDNIEAAQKAIDEWEDSLLATAGELVPEKCKWFLVAQQWKNNKWTILKRAGSDRKLYIRDGAGTLKEIQNCEAMNGEMALGIAFSPGGSTKDEFLRLSNKVKKWAECVRTGHLNRSEAWIGLNTTIMKTIEYSLPATTLTKKDCANIMKPVLQVGLSKAGICRNLSRDVVFASTCFQGLGISNPFWIQGVSKIQCMFDLHQVLTQQLIDVSWGKTIMESGLGPNFWNNKYDVVEPLLTKGWITTIWEFLNESNAINLQRTDGLFCRELRFQGDDYLMKVIIANAGFRGTNFEL